MNNTSETKKFYYDSENRMIKYEHYPSDSSPKDTTAEYSYDIFGRRLTKTVNGTITKFIYDGTAVSYELDSNNQPKIKYFTGFRTDEYLGHLNYSEVTDWGGFIQNPMNQGGYIYFTDQVGTIEKVIKDNSTGDMKEQRTYDVFGNLINHTGENTTPIGFQSKYYDTESGLYYYYHRYYDPNTGRFTTEDPIGISGGLNLYRFVNNNPVNYVDPRGLYGRNWVKEHNIAAGKEIDSNTIVDVDEYMHFLWDVARYTMEDTWNDISEFDYCHFWECINKDKKALSIAISYATWKFLGSTINYFGELNPEIYALSLPYHYIDITISNALTTWQTADLFKKCWNESKR